MQLKRALISSGTLLALTASLTLGGAVTPASPAIWSKKRGNYRILTVEIYSNNEVDVTGYDGKLKGKKSGAYTWIGSKPGMASFSGYLGLSKKRVISPSCVRAIMKVSFSPTRTLRLRLKVAD